MAMMTKILFAGLCIAAIFHSCNDISKTKGIVTKVANEEHIQTATIVTNDGDTLSFSILGTSIDQSQKIRPGDTLEVMHSGKYHPCMVAESVSFRPSREGTDMGLGKMQVHSYDGLLPAASCPGIEYKLTIRNREHSGDGTFRLTVTYKDAENGEDRIFTYNGRRFTLRGIPGDDNATVWQCVADNDNKIFNFLRVDANTLTLLNDKCEKSQDNLNYNLKLVE